jgi:hypothetical protein
LRSRPRLVIPKIEDARVQSRSKVDGHERDTKCDSRQLSSSSQSPLFTLANLTLLAGAAAVESCRSDDSEKDHVHGLRWKT